MAAMANVEFSSFSALFGAHISVGLSLHHLSYYCMQVNDGLRLEAAIENAQVAYSNCPEADDHSETENKFSIGCNLVANSFLKWF